jgi:hypothetical protein
VALLGFTGSHPVTALLTFGLAAFTLTAIAAWPAVRRRPRQTGPARAGGGGPLPAVALLALGTLAVACGAQLVTDPPQGRRTLARFLSIAPRSHPAAARIRDLLR